MINVAQKAALCNVACSVLSFHLQVIGALC
jgi:hypothetical protein